MTLTHLAGADPFGARTACYRRIQSPSPLRPAATRNEEAPMDFAKLLDRVKNILTNPKAEWPVIAAEPATVQSLFLGYALPLAGAAALAGLIGNAIFGLGVVYGVVGGIVGLAVGLGLVYVMGIVAS